jgi:exopolysaccharide biosynthesis polyprenyl glycosylphosphotransferase
MKRFQIIFMVLQVPLDALMLILAVVSAYLLRFTHIAVALKQPLFDLTLIDFVGIALLVIPVWLVIFAMTGLYSLDPNRKFSSVIIRILLGCSTGIAVLAMYILFTQQLFDSRFLVAASWVFAVFYVGLGRLFIRALQGILYRVGVGLRRVVIIGKDDIAKNLIETLSQRKELGYVVIASYKNFDKVVAKRMQKNIPDEIIITNPRAHEDHALAAFDFANEHHIGFKYSADLFATLSANMRVNPLGGVPIVELQRTRLDGWGRVVKRLFDVIMSIVVLIITSPILLLTAIVILFETGRPVIYKNERVGVRTNNFFTFKLRSMHQKDSTGAQFGKEGKNAEKAEKELIKKQGTKTGPIYKIANDPRVTRVGKFIRRWSIDELPQFVNVLRGEMSIVGPRPHQPREVAGYNKKHKYAFFVKPGITGLAQISGRSDLSYEEEMRLDILYIERWSIWLDMIIFVKTPFILFKKRKAL